MRNREEEEKFFVEAAIPRAGKLLFSKREHKNKKSRGLCDLWLL